jgi:6-phosphofructokinase 1
VYNLNKLIGAAVVGQSGGPTAAINATLAGVVRGALAADEITKLYGMRNGVEGLLEERMVDLSELFGGDDAEDALRDLEHTPAAALGSCRKKLPSPSADTGELAKLVEIFKKYDIRYFFYIGGNDSMDTVAKLTEYTRTVGYEMRIVGLPKTIDNDLCGTDHTPGYGSAAKYIATTLQEIVRDCAVYRVKAVTIVEIMGRDSGWLTVAAALPRIISGSAPDLVYLPERDFSMESFFKDVKAELAKKPNVVVAVSEGAHFADGRYVGESTQSGSVDVFGHKYLAGTAKALEFAVKDEIGCKVRSIELNLPQRCAAHLASETDLTESADVGKAGVAAAVNGASGCMMSIVRSSGEYAVTYEPKDIAGIANKVRTVPDEYINEAGNNVTDECLEYIKPLIAGQPVLRYKDGLPVIYVI